MKLNVYIIKYNTVYLKGRPKTTTVRNTHQPRLMCRGSAEGRAWNPSWWVRIAQSLRTFGEYSDETESSESPLSFYRALTGRNAQSPLWPAVWRDKGKRFEKDTSLLKAKAYNTDFSEIVTRAGGASLKCLIYRDKSMSWSYFVVCLVNSMSALDQSGSTKSHGAIVYH